MMKNTKWHILFWTCYFFYAYITDLIIDFEYTTFVKELVFFFTANIYLFYTLYYCIRKFSTGSIFETCKSICRIIVVIVIFFLIRHGLRYLIITEFFDDIKIDFPIHKWFVSNVLWIGNYILFASGYFYFQSSIQKQKDLLKAQEEKLTKEKEKIQLEKENVQLENTALRAQINPHFLYNTLDFLYAKALPVSDELSDGVMKLSDIMRYSLKPQDTEGLVFLTDEAEHIQNIIEMNQLRFDNKLNVHFIAGNIPDHVKIMPLLLITMVENVFKHGTTNSPEFPASIALSVDSQDMLHFSTHNKKRTGPKEHSTGIGLKNTLKRLENTYGERCKATTENEPDAFKVEIHIQLQRNHNNYLV